MGAIAGLLGLGGGQGGTGNQAPTLANVVQPTNAAQLGGAYQGNQQALAQQQSLLNALQGQNGIGNQSQVFNQLQGVANGTGPNPAQAMLNQQTGTNVANQAALMAGQRGASANPALIARQAAQQGAATQQQAVGQGAALQANQSLNALNSMGQLANVQAGNQIGAVGANTSAQQAEQQQLLNAQAAANQANVANQASVNQGNASLAGQRQGQQGGVLGGIASGIGSIFGLANGGPVPGPSSRFGQMLANGGNVGSALKSGGNVPGSPKHPGNDYRNDTVKALLSPGEVVIPNSVMQSKDPVRGAAQFVQAQLAKKRK